MEKSKAFTTAHQFIMNYIEYYDHERFQKKLGDLSPVECRELIAA
ncbi:IS3 family transposase [Paenibacillus sp. 481]|nr:IS3 family transposase [Paenibacillus sp. 481]